MADIAVYDEGIVEEYVLSLFGADPEQPSRGSSRSATSKYICDIQEARRGRALRNGFRNVAAGFEEADARAAALSGYCRTARRHGRPALALALCGDTAQAEKLAAETSKLFPNGTLWNAVQLPEIRAAIEIERGQPVKALEPLASAAEFGKIVDHKGASCGTTWLYPNWGLYDSISYLGLARACVLTGDTVEAKKAYQNFVANSKDADTDALTDATQDLAALR